MCWALSTRAIAVKKTHVVMGAQVEEKRQKINKKNRITGCNPTRGMLPEGGGGQRTPPCTCEGQGRASCTMSRNLLGTECTGWWKDKHKSSKAEKSLVYSRNWQPESRM